MTNTKLLREKISASGYKISFIANQCGITYQGFLKKLNNQTEFKASEMMILRVILNLTDEEWEQIFFAKKEDLQSTKDKGEGGD